MTSGSGSDDQLLVSAAAVAAGHADDDVENESFFRLFFSSRTFKKVILRFSIKYNIYLNEPVSERHRIRYKAVHSL